MRSDGVVVTNCHVVEGGSKITVSTSEAEPREFDARVIGGDCLHDLAVLKIDATGLPTVQLGDSGSLQLGQRVVALGYALALEGGPTVTTGIVSSLDRTIQAQDPNCEVCDNGVRTYSDVIQTDAAINHGNSGGPLVDMQGRVVGINSAGDDSAENIGFAISIDSAKDTIAQAQTDPLAATAYLGRVDPDRERRARAAVQPGRGPRRLRARHDVRRSRPGGGDPGGRRDRERRRHRHLLGRGPREGPRRASSPASRSRSRS